MSTQPLTPPGNLLQDLLACWKKEFPKRASGGWWALSGFALQTSVYLLRFFQQVEKGAEPGLLAEMEHLSDILCPADGKLTLIQVKKTLTYSSLIKAVEEAYLITDLCRRQTPDLLNNLRFQIACGRRATATAVADLSMSEVISSGDVASWDSMLRSFDKVAPITEEPDALDQLYTFLWNVGIRNPHALIERSVGNLLMNFGIRDPASMRQVGREVADYFFAAERHDKWDPVGDLLTAEDTIIDSKAAEYTGVLTGQQPRLEHLIKGFFRDRPQIFQDLLEAFKCWVLSLDHLEREVDDKVPVFWIGGRSGEGKSVLLIQLVAAALRSGIISPLMQLKAGDDLPRLAASAPDRRTLSDRGVGRIFAMVDDVYDLHRQERDEWDAIILNECDYRPPPIAIITCGPTEQKEQFIARLSGQFEVTSFEVPMLSIEECRAFLGWYESRTGQAREWDELTIENPLLVQLIFELAHGERMPDFARRFKKRLTDMNLFDVARAILAVNALYLDAPSSLITKEESCDALEYLCSDEQLHFRVTVAGDAMNAAGVRLAHPHLAWLLFIEWVKPTPTTLAKAWARELSRSLSIFEELPGGLLASNLLHQLLHTTRLSDEDSFNSEPLTANRVELIRELYRLHASKHDGHPSPRTLSRWLDLEYKIPGLGLTPDPAEFAVSCFADPALAHTLHGAIGGWVWRIAETRANGPSMRAAVKEFFLTQSTNPTIGFALARLASKRRNDMAAIHFANEWLVANSSVLGACQLISTMVANDGNDSAARAMALRWLSLHRAHPQASHVIITLVASDASDPEIRDVAVTWLSANLDNPQVYHVLPPLIAANPGDSETRNLALRWLTINNSHSFFPPVLSRLIRANPSEVAVRTLGFDWLVLNPLHPRCHLVLNALIAADPADTSVKKWALDWLAANDEHPQASRVVLELMTHPDNAEVRLLPQAYPMIVRLVTYSPDDAVVIAWIAQWLAATEPANDNLTAPLVADDAVNRAKEALTRDWLVSNKTHPQAYQLIASLVAANQNDDEVRGMALSWLESNEGHPQYHELLKVMIARSDGAKEWLDRGELYVQKPESVHPEAIVWVLVTAGKADPKYVEIAFEFMDGMTLPMLRPSMMYHLSRALVRNFDNAVQYLKGSYAERRKKTICASIALGMKRFPDTVAFFALEVVPQLDPDHVYHILWNVVACQLEHDYLDEMITQWLIDNYRRRGYGGMLRALQKTPAFWERLLILEGLPKRVVGDYDTLTTE